MNKFFSSLFLIIFLLTFLCSCGTLFRYNGDIFIHSNNVATNIHGKAMFWRQLPITIVVDRNISNEQKEKIEAAANTWNQSVRCRVFTVKLGDETEGKKGTIFVYRKNLGKNNGNRVLGEATRYYDVDVFGIPEYIRYARIKVYTHLPLHLWEKALLHELGHCLGFAHDRDIKSIMWPYLNESSGVILQEDIKEIKRHCPRPACRPNYCPLP